MSIKKRQNTPPPSIYINITIDSRVSCGIWHYCIYSRRGPNEERQIHEKENLLYYQPAERHNTQSHAALRSQFTDETIHRLKNVAFPQNGGTFGRFAKLVDKNYTSYLKDR